MTNDIRDNLVVRYGCNMLLQSELSILYILIPTEFVINVICHLSLRSSFISHLSFVIKTPANPSRPGKGKAEDDSRTVHLLGQVVRKPWATYPTVMLNEVKHLNTITFTNRFLTSFEMTGKKESGKTILGQPGGFVEQDGSFYDFVSFRHSSMVFRVNTQLRCVEDGVPDLFPRSQEPS